MGRCRIHRICFATGLKRMAGQTIISTSIVLNNNMESLALGIYLGDGPL
jgi:hypothetical protein